ncbi:MAG: putative lipid II flippase FtsW [Planctomycetota bacterium]
MSAGIATSETTGLPGQDRLEGALRRRRSRIDAAIDALVRTFSNPRGMITSCTIGLVAMGLVMVYSASAPTAYRFGAPTALFEKQTLYALSGLLAFLFCSHFDYHRLGKRRQLLYGAGVLLLVATFIPHVGMTLNGARRWLGFAGITFQPADWVKVSLTVMLAHLLAEKQSILHHYWRGFVPPFVVFLLPWALVIVQPDMGNAILLLLTCLAMMFVAGMPLRHLFTSAIPAVPVIALVVIKKGEYIQQRILQWWGAAGSKEMIYQGKNYQVNMSLSGLAEGGWFGRGLGASVLKVYHLPEAYNDFILAVVGEELGVAGLTFILLLLGLIAFQGLRLAKRAPDMFGRLLALGITFSITVQAMINLAVVTRSMPTKGISFPLVSYGGSSLVLTLAALGILCNVAKQTDIKAKPAQRGAEPYVEPAAEVRAALGRQEIAALKREAGENA